MQGHDKALDKLPSRVAAMVPEEQFAEALAAAGLRASNSRFVNFAELAAIEALQVPIIRLLWRLEAHLNSVCHEKAGETYTQ